MRTGIISSSTLCLPLLHYLHSQQEAICVFSAEQIIQNTGAVFSFCSGAGISYTHENSGQSINDWVAVQQPDIVFVIGYGRKIVTAGMPELFNVHFGHLPQFRGADPVFWQLKKGVQTLAICIHGINERYDAGAVVWKKEYGNEPFFSYGYVHQLMSHYLVEGVNYLLQLKKKCYPINRVAQDEQLAAYYSRPAMADVCIQWNSMRMAEICDLIKACNPWSGGAITTYNGFEIRVSDAEPFDYAQDPVHRVDSQPAGTILDTNKGLLVLCINNEILTIHTLTVNGILMPARFAANYGFVQGQSFKNI